MLKKTLICFIVLNSFSFAMGADTNPLPKTRNYKLDLKIDYNTQRLYGTCEITILNDTDQPIVTVPVLLYRLMTVSSVHNDDHIGLPFTQNVVSISGWEQIQVNFIEISLNKTLAPGEQTKIEIEYEGYLFGYSAEGWRYVKDHIDRNFTLIRTDGFGYPIMGYPDERDMMMIAQEQYDYLINITVPSDMFVVTGGKCIGVTKTDNEATFVFRSKKPSWRLDIAIADYQIFKKGENEVYYFPSDSIGAQRVMTALDASYELYTGWFGPLDDYQGFSIIEVPEGYSSQKDITAIILSAENFSESNEMLTIYHEIAHSWNVTNLDAQPCRFESEGFAQFLQYLLSEKLDKKQNVVSEAAQRFLDRVRNTFNEKKELQTIPIKDYGVYDMVDYSYTLGMVVFAIFYDLVGEDYFNKIIGSFYSAYNDRGATLNEFINHCKKLTPIDLEGFFNDWIYTTKGIQLVVEGKSFDELKQYYKGL
ncbi:hypothetical protein JW824_07370 [bacterium]|nr:hypothetical protein [bacterium]RQV95138.1 MAG: hypothetical protein EH221_06735 [bacterium]